MADDAAIFVGIDVGKYQVDVALGAEGPVRQFKNDDEGIDQVLKLLGEHRIALVVMEASGGYQRQLLASLLAQKLAALAVNPRQVRDFAKAVGKLEKTDKVDARILALFAERIRPAARPVVDETLEQVSDWLARRRQLVEMLTAEKNRRQQAQGAIRRNIEAPHHLAQSAAPGYREGPLGHHVGVLGVERRCGAARR
jgi:transposase